MSFINKAILRGYKAPRPHGHNEPLPDFTIKLHEGGSLIHGLTVDAGYGGPRDLTCLPGEHRKSSLGNLQSPGHVDFFTAKGKRWQIKLSEFSFVFNWQKPKVETKPKEPDQSVAAAA